MNNFSSNHLNNKMETKTSLFIVIKNKIHTNEWHKTKQSKIEALFTHEAQVIGGGCCCLCTPAWRSSPAIISLRTALVLGRFTLSWLRIIVVDLWNFSLKPAVSAPCFVFAPFPEGLPAPPSVLAADVFCVHLLFVWLTGCHGAVCETLWFSAGKTPRRPALPV